MDLTALGDPFRCRRIALVSRSEIARLFGDAFPRSCSTWSWAAGRAPSSPDTGCISCASASV